MKLASWSVLALVPLAAPVLAQGGGGPGSPLPFPREVSLAGAELVLVAPGDCLVEDALFASQNGGCEDLTSGLVWGADKVNLTWEEADLYCQTLVEGGFDDWFFPSRDELLELSANGGGTHLNFASPSKWSSTKKGRWKAYLVHIVAGTADPDLIGSRRSCLCARAPGGPPPPPDPDVLVSSISPNSMMENSIVSVVITGSGFLPGADVDFENGSGPYPGPAPSASSAVVLDASTITADVTAQGGGPTGVKKRKWDVRVTNPDNTTGVLPNGFTVVRN